MSVPDDDIYDLLYEKEQQEYDRQSDLDKGWHTVELYETDIFEKNIVTIYILHSISLRKGDDRQKERYV